MIDQFLDCGTIFSKGESHFLIGYGKRSWSEKAVQPSWYFPDFFLEDEKPWFAHEHWALVSRAELSALLDTNFAVNTLSWESPYEKVYERMFCALQQHFVQKTLFKAVPYLVERAAAPINKTRLRQMLKVLLEHVEKRKLTLYGFWDEAEGILGATPELLFEQNDENKLSAMACAATLQAGEKPTAERQLKLRKEHDIVIEDLVLSLAPFGKVMVDKPAWEQYHTLQHLVTPINLQLKQKVPHEDLIRAIHPTAALGAYPKAQGMQWLKDYAVHIPRKRYGAPVGFIFKEMASFHVGIRNVQWDESGFSIAAGGGVIPESDFVEEKQEISAKLSAIKGSLAL